MGLRRIARLVRYSFTFIHLHLHSTPSFISVTSVDVERKLSGASPPPTLGRSIPSGAAQQHSHHLALRNALRNASQRTSQRIASRTSHRISSHFLSHHISHFATHFAYHHITAHSIALRTAFHSISSQFDLDNMSLHCINAKDFDLCLARHSFAFHFHLSPYHHLPFIHAYKRSSLRACGGRIQRLPSSSFYMLEESSQHGGTSTSMFFSHLMLWVRGNVTAKYAVCHFHPSAFGSHH